LNVIGDSTGSYGIRDNIKGLRLQEIARIQSRLCLFYGFQSFEQGQDEAIIECAGEGAGTKTFFPGYYGKQADQGFDVGIVESGGVLHVGFGFFVPSGPVEGLDETVFVQGLGEAVDQGGIDVGVEDACVGVEGGEGFGGILDFRQEGEEVADLVRGGKAEGSGGLVAGHG